MNRLLLAIILLSLNAVQAQRPMDQKLIDITVKLEALYKGESQGKGFGFIVAKSDDSVYIATAGHNCHIFTDKPDSSRVEINYYDGTKSTARLVYLSDRDIGSTLDLAILKAIAPSNIPFRNHDAVFNSVSENDNVWFIGYKRDWKVSDKGRIKSMFPNEFTVLSTEVRKGNSGAPVIRGGKIVGMIIINKNVEYVAHSIDTINKVAEARLLSDIFGVSEEDLYTKDYRFFRKKFRSIKTMHVGVNVAQTLIGDGLEETKYVNGISLGYAPYYLNRISVFLNADYNHIEYTTADDSYETNILGLSANGRVNLFSVVGNASKLYLKRPKINLWGTMGVGLDYVNHKKVPISSVEFSDFQPKVQYGMGVDFKLTPLMDITIGGVFNKYFGDYILFGNSVNSPADPTNDPSDNDGIFTLSIGINYYLVPKSKSTK